MNGGSRFLPRVVVHFCTPSTVEGKVVGRASERGTWLMLCPTAEGPWVFPYCHSIPAHAAL